MGIAGREVDTTGQMIRALQYKEARIKSTVELMSEMIHTEKLELEACQEAIRRLKNHRRESRCGRGSPRR